MLARIKIMLGIEDELQDELLDILVSNVENHLKSLLSKDVPEELEFIVEEITVRRFNRLGSEGYKTDSVEGHSISFYDLSDEFTPYLTIINNHKDDDYESANRGKAMFF